jgi:signal peptidase I
VRSLSRRLHALGAVRQVLLAVGAQLVLNATVLTVVALTAFDRYRPPTAAMEPTIHFHQRIWARPGGAPQVGDVVTLPIHRVADDQGPPVRTLTRIVAVGGQTVECRGGQLRIDGRSVDEPYLMPRSTLRDFAPIEVPRGHVFFLADNRGNSVGSELVGTVPASAVVDRVLWIGVPSMGPLVVLTAFLWAAWLGLLWTSLVPRARMRILAHQRDLGSPIDEARAGSVGDVG